VLVALDVMRPGFLSLQVICPLRRVPFSGRYVVPCSGRTYGRCRSYRPEYLELAGSACSPNTSAIVGLSRRRWHPKPRIEHFDRFYRSLQREPAHRNCELIEEAHLSNHHRPSGAPLLQESDLGLPLDEDIIPGIAWSHKPHRRIGELHLRRRTTYPEKYVATGCLRINISCISEPRGGKYVLTSRINEGIYGGRDLRSH